MASNERELLILSDGYIVTKLFKSSLIHNNGIHFRPNVKLEEYGHILKSNSVAKECQNAIKAAILHFYKTGIFCCIHDDGTEMSHRELINLIKIRNAKNNIFIKGYDNPYFQHTTNEYTIDLMKQIDKISI